MGFVIVNSRGRIITAGCCRTDAFASLKVEIHALEVGIKIPNWNLDIHMAFTNCLGVKQVITQNDGLNLWRENQRVMSLKQSLDLPDFSIELILRDRNELSNKLGANDTRQIVW